MAANSVRIISGQRLKQTCFEKRLWGLRQQKHVLDLFRMDIILNFATQKRIKLSLKEPKGRLQVQSDWLDWEEIFQKVQRRIELNRFQIQMEGPVDIIQQISTFSSSQSLICSTPHHSQPTDDFAFTISQLILLQKPIFVVTHQTHSSRNEEFSRQQMLKQKILSYNRKEKSLEELSKKFIQNFEGKDGFMLELDKVTIQLKVQRRRIYDIVNIFESLQVVKKAAKNNYVWRGLKEAIKTINSIEKSGHDYSSNSFKKEKSLQNLAARFLKLFIFATQPITLEEAAKILIHTQDSALIKTKIRRLYDIVNVFKSIGIVQKVYLPTKKPGFQWIGVNKLLEVIEQKKEKCSEVILEKMSLADERENIQAEMNQQNAKIAFECQDKKWVGFTNKFDQKVFQPSILKRSSTTLTMAGSLESMIDVCAQY